MEFLPPATKPVASAIALALLWAIEGAIPMFEGREARGRHDASNLALGIGNALLASLLFAGATLFVTEWAREQSLGLLHWLALPAAWSVVAAVVLLDLWQYVWHRMNHRIPVLWRFHAVHHADRELDASSGLRFHTGEILLSGLARLAVLPLLGLTIGQVLVYETLVLPVVLFHHSNIRLPSGVDRSLRWLIVTPWMHWVHHSDYQPETDSNYSSLLSVWDRLFRTFRLRNDPREITLGLDGKRYQNWATLPGMLAMPFRRNPTTRRRDYDEAAHGSASDPGENRGSGPTGPPRSPSNTGG